MAKLAVLAVLRGSPARVSRDQRQCPGAKRSSQRLRERHELQYLNRIP